MKNHIVNCQLVAWLLIVLYWTFQCLMLYWYRIDDESIKSLHLRLQLRRVGQQKMQPHWGSFFTILLRNPKKTPHHHTWATLASFSLCERANGASCRNFDLRIMIVSKRFRKGFRRFWKSPRPFCKKIWRWNQICGSVLYDCYVMR